MIDAQLQEEIRHLHAELCSALADPTRILILYSLSDQALQVNEIVKIVNATQSTVSRHLQVLRSRNLVTAVRDSNRVIYSLTDHRVIDALDLLRAVMSDNLSHQGSLAEKVELTQASGGKNE